MNKIKRSWKLLKNSFLVLKKNKKLLLFPAISLIGMIGILVFFLFAFSTFTIQHDQNKKCRKVEISNFILSYKCGTNTNNNGSIKSFYQKFDSPLLETLNNLSADENRVEKSLKELEQKMKQHSFIKSFSILFLYFASMFLTTFFNVAFYSEIIQTLNGNGVSILRGFRCAKTKILQILIWSLFAGVVGYLIKALEEKFGFIGKIVMNLIGITWSIASVFAIPVIIREQENVNPIDYLKKSALSIKNTWGEGLIGYMGFSGVSSLFFLVTFFILGIPFLIFIFQGAVAASLITIGIWLIILIAYSYIVNIMEKIYLCSLYIYASEGAIPECFNQEDMDSAWKVKKTEIISSSYKSS